MLELLAAGSLLIALGLAFWLLLDSDDDNGGGDDGEHQGEVAACLVARVAALGLGSLTFHIVQHGDPLCQLMRGHMVTTLLTITSLKDIDNIRDMKHIYKQGCSPVDVCPPHSDQICFPVCCFLWSCCILV